MKQVSILKGILIVSVIAVLIYPVYLFVFLYPSFQEIIIKEKESEAEQIVTYLVDNFDITTSVLNRWAEYLTLEQLEEIKTIRKKFNLYKIRVFSSRGTIIYSTNIDEIDSKNEKEYFESIVKKGKVYSIFVKKGRTSAEGTNITTNVVEVYVPIMLDNSFSGAVEVYYDITGSINQYNELFEISNYIISLIVFTLFIALSYAFYKAYSNIKIRDQIEKQLIVQKIDLEKALDEIKTLKGIVPICSYCKKVRDDEGFWQQVGDYINKHSDASVSHGICPDCVKEHFPDMKSLHKRLGLNK